MIIIMTSLRYGLTEHVNITLTNHSDFGLLRIFNKSHSNCQIILIFQRVQRVKLVAIAMVHLILIPTKQRVCDT